MFMQKMNSMIHIMNRNDGTLPIFKTEAQAAALEALLLSDRPLSTREIITATGASQPTLHRELTRLVDAGLLVRTTVGRSALFAPDEANPAVAPLRTLITLSRGPQALIRTALADVPGISRALIFGSFAARSTGAPGAAPDDIDLLIVGSPVRRDVYDALDPLDQALRREVNVTFLSDDRWDAAEDEIVTRILGEPRLELLP